MVSNPGVKESVENKKFVPLLLFLSFFFLVVKRPIRPGTIHDKNGGDLFSNNVDNISEQVIKNLLEDLNQSVEKLVFNLLCDVKNKNKNSRRSSSAIGIRDSNLLLTDFLSYQNLHDNSRDRILEYIYHDSILASIHKYFFDGDNFFGVGSDFLQKRLESMLGRLMASGFLFSFLVSLRSSC
jgi:hypothetical protein